jgi:hypothetical protein
MTVITENENELRLKLNPVLGIDLLSLGVIHAFFLVIPLLTESTIEYTIWLLFLYTFMCTVPGYIIFSIFPIKVDIDKKNNTLSYTTIGTTMIALDQIKNIRIAYLFIKLSK